MKRLFTTLVLSGLVAFPALADDPKVGQSEEQAQREHAEHKQDEHKQDKDKQAAAATLMSSNKIIGATIYDGKENSLGDINTLVLDKEGNVHFAIVGVGGLVGIGESEVAVPFKAIRCQCTTEGDETWCRPMMSMSADQLEQAPKLKAKNYAELRDKNWLATNAKFYSQEAPKTTMSDDAVCLNTVTDAEITGQGGSELGHLDAVVLDLNEGKARYAVVGYGGAVGVGETYVAVPYEKLTFKKDGEEYLVSMNGTASSIKSAPKVTPGEYPELKLASVRKQIDDSETRR